MNIPSALIAAALLAAGTGASADPAQSTGAFPQQESTQPQMVLASAEAVRAPDASVEQPASTPRRPRIARVTTCRCAGEAPAEPRQER